MYNLDTIKPDPTQLQPLFYLQWFLNEPQKTEATNSCIKGLSLSLSKLKKEEKIKGKENKKKGMTSGCAICCEILIAILLPPLGVCLRHGCCSVSLRYFLQSSSSLIVLWWFDLWTMGCSICHRWSSLFAWCWLFWGTFLGLSTLSTQLPALIGIDLEITIS